VETAYVGHNMSQIAHEEDQKKFVLEVKTRDLFSHKHQLNILTICDAIVNLLPHVSTQPCNHHGVNAKFKTINL
jgi:hypothetical protein